MIDLNKYHYVCEEHLGDGFVVLHNSLRYADCPVCSNWNVDFTIDDYNDLKSELESKDSDYDDLRQEFDNLEEEFDDLETVNGELKEEISFLESELKELKDERYNLKLELEELKCRLGICGGGICSGS